MSCRYPSVIGHRDTSRVYGVPTCSIRSANLEKDVNFGNQYSFVLHFSDGTYTASEKFEVVSNAEL